MLSGGPTIRRFKKLVEEEKELVDAGKKGM